MKKNIHVVPHDGKWSVKAEKAERPSNLFNTQREAISRGVELAKRNESELLIHNEKEKIREKNSYGKDSYTPRG